MGLSTTLKRIALAMCLLGVAVFVRLLFVLHDRLDPQGDSNGVCIASPLQPVTNDSGMEVTGHLTVCDSMFIHDSATYIYLHKRDEKESPRSLVFRFSDDPYVASPAIKWISPSQLAISVDSVDLVTKIVPYFAGVAIAYSIGREKEDREQWQQQVLDFKRMMVVGSVSIVVLLLLVVWLWLSIRSDKRAQRGASTGS
jgi:hypothetical protein